MLPTSRTIDKLETVQVMRAVAAILVVVVHAINANDFRTDMPRSWLAEAGYFNGFGACGVDMFFVVSGFIMSHAMLKAAPDSAGRFLLQRFIRVVPPFWLAALFSAAVLSMTDRRFPFVQYLTGLTVFPLTPANAFVPPILPVGWTLAFELGFYGVVAIAIASAAADRRLSVMMKMVWLIAAAGLLFKPQSAFAATWVNAIWAEFGIGVFVYSLWRWSTGKEFTAGAILLLAAGLAAYAFGIVQGYPFDSDAPALIAGDSGLQRAIWWALPAAAILLGLLWLSRLVEAVERNFVWRSLIHVGDASYSLYLLHLPIIFLYEDYMPANSANPDLVILITVVVNVGIALCAYRWIEQPLLSWLRRRLLRRPRVAGAAPVAV